MTKKRLAVLVLGLLFLLGTTMSTQLPLLGMFGSVTVWAQDDDIDDLFGDDGGGDAGGGDDLFGDDGGSADAGASTSSGPAVHEDEQMKEYKPLDDAKDPKDPFKPTIEPPMPTIAPRVQIEKQTKRTQIPPLPIKVSFIVGSDTNRMALLELNGKPYEMLEGDSEDGGLFKVLEIGEKEVKIFDSRIQKKRVIKLTGE